MIQSLDKQLQVVIRALGDVVAPALAGGEKHVVEQLNLSIATLAFVAKRLPEARRFYRQELRAYLTMATTLAGVTTVASTTGERVASGEEIELCIAEGRATLDRAEADLADFEHATRRLREAITRLADAAHGTASRRDIERIMLEQSDGIIGQSRQWCSMFGLESDPQSLPQPSW